MVITKCEDVTKQGFCKILRLREGLLLSLILVCVAGSRVGVGVGVGAYLRLSVY